MQADGKPVVAPEEDSRPHPRPVVDPSIPPDKRPDDFDAPEARIPEAPASSAAPLCDEHADDDQPPGLLIRDGDLVVLMLADGKRLNVRAGQGEKGTHLGQVRLRELVGMAYGRAIYTTSGHVVYTLRPSLQDHVMAIRRITQIIYPKDIGTILMKLGIGEGSQVLECGTGSGALTLAMAWMAGPTGRIFSYEREKSHSERARYNLRRVGLLDRVVLKVRDVNEEGFDERGVHAVFLDVREPPEILEKVTKCLSPGGVLGFLVPTANQVSDVIRSLQDAPYTGTEVLETYFRRYKVNADRFRPEDRMIGHTGYLIFTRRIVLAPEFIAPPPKEPWTGHSPSASTEDGATSPADPATEDGATSPADPATETSDEGNQSEKLATQGANQGGEDPSTVTAPVAERSGGKLEVGESSAGPDTEKEDV